VDPNDIRINSKSRRDDPRRMSMGGSDRLVQNENILRSGVDAGPKTEKKQEAQRVDEDQSGISIARDFSGFDPINGGIEEECLFFGNDNDINRLMK